MHFWDGWQENCTVLQLIWTGTIAAHAVITGQSASVKNRKVLYKNALKNLSFLLQYLCSKEMGIGNG